MTASHVERVSLDGLFANAELRMRQKMVYQLTDAKAQEIGQRSQFLAAKLQTTDRPTSQRSQNNDNSNKNDINNDNTNYSALFAKLERHPHLKRTQCNLIICCSQTPHCWPTAKSGSVTSGHRLTAQLSRSLASRVSLPSVQSMVNR